MSSIIQIKRAISELQAEGKRISTVEIGKKLNVSRQYVHKMMSEHEELSELTIYKRKASKGKVLKELMTYQTGDLHIEDILNLPIDGMENFTYETLRRMLIEKKISYSETFAEKMAQLGIDTSQYTARELFVLTGASGGELTQQQFSNKLQHGGVPFKRIIVTDEEMKERCAALKGVDATQHTLDELHEIVGLDLDRRRVQRYFLQEGVEYQRMTGKVKSKKKI